MMMLSGLLEVLLRGVGLCMLFKMLPCFLGGWDSGWVGVHPASLTAEDVCQWPYSVAVLANFVAFLSTLHWPDSGADLGVGGVSYVELLILCELWAGERLVLASESAAWAPNFQCRLFLLVQALIFGALAGSWWDA